MGRIGSDFGDDLCAQGSLDFPHCARVDKSVEEGIAEVVHGFERVHRTCALLFVDCGMLCNSHS